MFNLKIEGNLPTNISAGELGARSTGFGKAWTNTLREFDAIGVKLVKAEIEYQGKNTPLPTDIHAVAGV